MPEALPTKYLQTPASLVSAHGRPSEFVPLNISRRRASEALPTRTKYEQMVYRFALIGKRPQCMMDEPCSCQNYAMGFGRQACRRVLQVTCGMLLANRVVYGVPMFFAMLSTRYRA